MSNIADDVSVHPCYTVSIENCIKTASLMGAILWGFLYARRRWPMPRKPKRPCSYPGCPKLTDGRFCEEHQKLENQRYEKYDRDPAAKRRYGRAWKRIRDRYMNAHPLCERCQRDGRLVKAEQVHHIKPLAEGGDHSETNLMSLCSSCHAKIHAERGDRWHNH